MKNTDKPVDLPREGSEESRRRISEQETPGAEAGIAAGELDKSEKCFRALIENAMDIILVFDASGIITYANPAIERVLGYTPEEFTGSNGFEVIHPDDIRRSAGIVEHSFGDSDFSPYVELRVRHKDGSWHFMEGIGKNFIGNPAVRGIILNLRDIGERKRMEKELYDRNQELEAFAHTISHDLQTPVAIVEGYAKAALEADAEGRPEAERDCLESIIKGARRMSDLIESLLQYARAGHLEGEAACVEPEEVLLEVLLDLEESISEKGVKMVVGEDLPAVLVDPAKLRQVFSNLVDNAVKHLGDSTRPTIEIEAERDKRMATFHVRDNGVGIPPEVLGKIFEPFKRFSTAGTQGLGIGLSTVKRAVETWGGEVWVESTPGEGAAFFFTVPAAQMGVSP